MTNPGRTDITERTTGRVDPVDHAHPVDRDAFVEAKQHQQNPTESEKEQLAEEIAKESPEGRPADAASGPKLLRGEVVLLVLGLAAVGALLAIFVRPVVGLAFAGIAMIAIVLNPVVVTTLLRARDREAVKHRRDRDTAAAAHPRL